MEAPIQQFHPVGKNVRCIVQLCVREVVVIRVCGDTRVGNSAEWSQLVCVILFVE